MMWSQLQDSITTLNVLLRADKIRKSRRIDYLVRFKIEPDGQPSLMLLDLYTFSHCVPLDRVIAWNGVWMINDEDTWVLTRELGGKPLEIVTAKKFLDLRPYINKYMAN